MHACMVCRWSAAAATAAPLRLAVALLASFAIAAAASRPAYVDLPPGTYSLHVPYRESCGTFRTLWSAKPCGGPNTLGLWCAPHAGDCAPPSVDLRSLSHCAGYELAPLLCPELLSDHACACLAPWLPVRCRYADDGTGRQRWKLAPHSSGVGVTIQVQSSCSSRSVCPTWMEFAASMHVI